MNSDSSNGRLFYIVTAGRLIILAAFLGITLILPEYPVEVPARISKLSILLGGAFALTALYLFWYGKKGLVKGLLWTQTGFDVLLVSLAVAWTGGHQSPFSFLYAVAIVTACLLGGNVEGAASAYLSTISYALLCWFGIREEGDFMYALYVFFFNLAAFNLIASLGIILARRLRNVEASLTMARKDLRRMEQIQRNLANSIQSGLITTDEKGRVTFFNRAAERILGLDIHRNYGRSLERIWPKGKQLLDKLGAGQKLERGELTFTDSGGESRLLGVSTFPLKDGHGQFLGYGVIFQDITEVKAREERLNRMERMAALGEMAAGLAHEIRNPLASLSGTAQFLEEMLRTTPEHKRLLAIIRRESDRLNELTKNFLLYARPERRVLQDISVLREIRSILDLLRQGGKLDGAEVVLDIGENLNVEADPDQFRQVMLNLLLNARQALADTCGRIIVSGWEEDGQAFIRIKDNGKGISPENLSFIFDPFFTTRPDGTGLGLAIAQRLVSGWSGNIEAESREGEGASFTLNMPLKSGPNTVQTAYR